ncbi:gamma-glutamyltransferase [Gammaproteobacteria bacterium]|nr:gamma-glutamyltransferase [Gammaproteobacteria bacterium]MDA9049169.1 gamma-glutamyltransferase [Gammaproteobacteria bacterium]MDA9340569.1 gamma-glutamyltransferase [Gammaproteobacteria bacterium]MDB9700996.1 gamma-glutamyltransferase [Gammaproteobacteria bacterium]MDB9896034.1 gamma-glutamyltransferase [Gammaproteobacteria bacterium]|tara:strand:- start:885 stop:2576 length:1692 start_codon:yes stop_codon:yes gene_type:complete
MKFFLSTLLILSCAIESKIFNSQAIVHPEIGANGMVVTQHYLATDVGHAILQKGGNAYDASIAVAFALAVVLPRAGNIGGGGFMLMHDGVTNKNYSIDYREIAPAKATKDMYLNTDGSVDRKRSTQGALAIGVPGTVYGMWEVHQKFGSLPWKELIKPAIDLASNGFKVSPFMADALNGRYKKLGQFKNFKKIFYAEYPVIMNSRLVQPELARTLKIIATKGVAGFYEGEIATLIADYMKKNNGLITKSDLANYRPVWREPIQGSYRDFQILTMPPPSSGGIHIIQMLNILEHYDLVSMGHNSPRYAALLTEVMKYAYADRSKYLGDPDFFDVPVNQLISKAYAKNIHQLITLDKITPSADILPGNALPHESLDTTHFSVADKDGNVVSNTYTLNSGFGSGVVINGTGVLMNNEMDDFVSSPGVPNQFGLVGGEANKIEPFKRPLSSMTPTIVFHDSKPIIATGSPGGSRIITAVLQFLLNTLDFKMEISDATVVPRIHHQWKPDVLMLEKGFDIQHIESIKGFNQKVYISGPGTSLESLEIKNNLFYGFGDTRRPDSKAKGL